MFELDIHLYYNENKFDFIISSHENKKAILS